MTEPPINIFDTLKADLLSELEEARGRYPGSGEVNAAYHAGTLAGLDAAMDAVDRVRRLVDEQDDDSRPHDGSDGVCWSGS